MKQAKNGVVRVVKTCDVVPNKYTCFCGKKLDPEVRQHEIPHSCGEICGKERNCEHKCKDPCHPGPCSPCETIVNLF
jgi:hypothetical protein